MYNKKTLLQAMAELNKAKAPKKPKDIITDPMGQWKHPGLPTRIPGNDITMEGVGYPVLGVANNGQKQIMQPGEDYTFPGADYVDEYPQMRKGGTRKRRKTKSLSGTNKLMLPNPLLRNYKNRVYDPNVDYFQDGGFKTNYGPDNDQKNFIKKHWKEPNYKFDSDGTYYEPMSQTIHIAQEHKNDKAKIEHEKMHHFQNLLDALRSDTGTPLRKPTIVENQDYEGEHYYNRSDDEFEHTKNEFLKQNPEFKFVPEDVNYQHIIPSVYNNPYTVEGEGRDYENYIESGGNSVFQDGGYIEADLTEDEIEEYRKGGYIVEDISVPELNQAQKGKTVKSKDGTVTNTITKANGDVVIQVKTKDGKYYEKVKHGLPQFVKDEFKKRAEWEDRSSGAAQPVDDFWTLPIGMTSAGVKGAGALAKGAGALLKNAGKSNLVQLSKAGTKAFFNKAWNKAPKWAPGMNLGNALTSLGIVEGATNYFDADSDVRKANKKAYKNPNLNTITDALGENILNSLDFSGLAAGNKIGKGVKQLGKYLNTKTPNKKLIPSMQFSGSELKNEYVPNTLIHHPDNQYILQNTPVKDFGIKLNIKNIPNKSKHGFDVSENEINQIVNQNLEYLTHPEYIKRRQATTGETPEKIKKEINKYVESLKNTKFDFDKPIKHDSYGYHKRGVKMLGKNIYKPQININSSDRDIKTKYDFLHILDHEIKHGLSPVSKNSFNAMPKYKNYPHIDLVKNKKNSAYHSTDYEQQVRMLRMRDYLNNKYGISKNKELSPEEWDIFANDWNNWLKEEHAGLGNKRVPRGLKDVRGMMQLKHPDISSEDLRKIINKSWALAPAGITGAALMNTPKQKKSNQMKKGGIVADLTQNEIDDYIAKGYIVEDID
jgi:hypothetical protein